MIKKATSGLLVMLLLMGMFGMPKAKAQTATPSEAKITVSGVPTGTKSLAVEVTVDAAVISLASATTTVSGGLAVTGSNGVGILSTSGDLPASLDITVTLGGVAAGTSAVTIGKVLDMIGGTEIAGASATSDVSSVTVGASTSTTSSTSSSTGGPGGLLSADTITVTITGEAVNNASALNVTLAFGTANVASLDSANPTFMGTGATQLLTASDPAMNILTAVWDGSITDNAAVITAMLAAGSTAGTTTISVTKVEGAGAVDITDSVVAQVSPSSVTNSAPGGTTGCGTFSLIGPDSVTGPGKVAVAFDASDASDGTTATLNGAAATITDDVGVAIVDVNGSSVALSLAVMCAAGSETVSLGSVAVTAGSGKAPVVKRATAVSKASGSKLLISGKNLKDASVSVLPDENEATSVKAKKKKITAKYDADNCIESGGFVNVTTTGGTSAKKIAVKGMCG